MRAPSADHSKPLTAVSLLVSCTASPPSGRIAKIWFLSPTRALVKPIHWLSGDHCAPPDDFGPRVSWTGVAAGGWDRPELRDERVLLEVGLGDAVDDPLAVGRDLHAADRLERQQVFDAGHAWRIIGGGHGHERWPPGTR